MKALPSELELKKWMADNDTGYKKAAKHYGFTIKEIRAIAAAGAGAGAGARVTDRGLDDFGVYERSPPRASLVLAPSQPASVAVGQLTKGCRVVGITKGQFSLLDLIRAVLEQTGPADVILSTWTVGIRDAETAAWLAQTGAIRSLSILTDKSFPTLKPEYCRRLLELFGSDAIVCSKTHAKFAVIQNDSWQICIRSSMNLNRNPRFEQFDLDESAEICSFFAAFAKHVRDNMRQGFDFSSNEVSTAFNFMLDGAGASPAEPDEAAAQRRVALAPLAYRKDKLLQLEAVIEAATCEKKVNPVGIAALMKSAMKLRGEIDALSAVALDEFGNMSRDEIREYLGTLLEEWPDEFIELAFLVYAEKHGGRVVFVAEGGRQTEYDAAEGWREVGSE